MMFKRITKENYSGNLPLLGDPKYYPGPDVVGRQLTKGGVWNKKTLEVIEKYTQLTWRDRIMWWKNESFCSLGYFGCLKYPGSKSSQQSSNGTKITTITSDIVVLHQHVGKFEFTMMEYQYGICKHYLKLVFHNGKIKKIGPQIEYKETRKPDNVLSSYGFWMYEKAIQSANPACYRLGRMILATSVRFYDFLYDWFDWSIINEKTIGNMRAVYYLGNPYRDIVFEKQGHKCAHPDCKIISNNNNLLHLSKKDMRRPNNLSNHQLLCRDHHDQLVAERRWKIIQFIKRSIK